MLIELNKDQINLLLTSLTYTYENQEWDKWNKNDYLKLKTKLLELEHNNNKKALDNYFLCGTGQNGKKYKVKILEEII